MLWLAILLGAAAVIAYAVWDYGRRSAARAAASKARFEQMFKPQSAAPPSPAEIAPPLTAVAAASPAPQASPAIAAVRAGDRFLGQTGAMVYGLLKKGMPGHEIFANVMLSSVVGAAGSGSQREQQVRRLSQYQIDFVICDRDMRIVAVVEIDAVGSAEAIGVQRFKADCLQAAGIRLVRIDATSPPRSEEIRALVGAGRPPPSAH